MRSSIDTPVRSFCWRSASVFLVEANVDAGLPLLPPGFILLRRFKSVIAGEFPRDRAQLEAVVRDLHGFHFVGVDARPDDVAVFARNAVLVAFFVEDDGAGLADQLEAWLR